MNDIILVCKELAFYSQRDQEIFLEWVSRLDCIQQVSGSGNELLLHLGSNMPADWQLRELIGLFYRYKIDMSQLSIFLTDENKIWFCNQDSKEFWYQDIFKESIE